MTSSQYLGYPGDVGFPGDDASASSPIALYFLSIANSGDEKVERMRSQLERIGDQATDLRQFFQRMTSQYSSRFFSKVSQLIMQYVQTASRDFIMCTL